MAPPTACNVYGLFQVRSAGFRPIPTRSCHHGATYSFLSARTGSTKEAEDGNSCAKHSHTPSCDVPMSTVGTCLQSTVTNGHPSPLYTTTLHAQDLPRTIPFNILYIRWAVNVGKCNFVSRQRVSASDTVTRGTKSPQLNRWTKDGLTDLSISTIGAQWKGAWSKSLFKQMQTFSAQLQMCVHIFGPSTD